MNEQTFINFLIATEIQYDESMLRQLSRYKELLQEYNQKFNLTAIFSDDEIYLKHFCDSLLLLKYISMENIKSIVDVGTGAGFPGIIIKIFHPEINLYLVESNTKKCSFLQLIKKELHIENMTILNSRAEEFALKNLDKFDIVVSRAVANLKVLTELCLPLVKIGGKFIAMKGKVEDELLQSSKMIEKLNGRLLKVEEYKLPEVEHDRSLVIVEKTAKTPNGYPRKYSEIVKSN